MSSTAENAIEAVREWARGLYALEAGVELLIRTGRVCENAPWVVRDATGRTYVDAATLADRSAVWSGGEQRLARIALSLMGGDPVNLAEDIPGLDREGAELVLAALAHANGSHEHSGFTRDEAGHPTGIAELPSLYPWPTAAK